MELLLILAFCATAGATGCSVYKGDTFAALFGFFALGFMSWYIWEYWNDRKKS